MKKGIEFLFDKLDEDIDLHTQAGIQSLLGVFNMMVGSVDEALFCLEESQKIYKMEKKEVLSFVNRSRTAVVLMNMSKFSKSYDILNSCLKVTKESKNKNIRNLIDRILIDLGKLKFYQNEFDASLEFFINAMDIRVSKGDIEKINQVQHLIQVVDKKIKTEPESINE